MAAYSSCNCRWCRSVPSKIKGMHKALAHRLFRRMSRTALRKDREAPQRVSTGYRY